jgi:Effector Associated Constant Component 1
MADVGHEGCNPTGDTDSRRLSIEISDPVERRSLGRWLDRAPDVEVLSEARPPQDGELGAVDIFTAIGSSTALIALVKTMPDFVRARRASVKVRIRVKGKDVTVDATNVADASALIERLLEQ